MRDYLSKMHAVLVTMLLVAVSNGSVASEKPKQHHLSAFIDANAFLWQEFNNNDVRLLDEIGPVFGAGIQFDRSRKSEDGFIYDASLRAYKGKISYDGQVLATGVKFTTNTVYTGKQLEFMGGYRKKRKQGFIDFLAGLGVDAWRREIQPGRDALGGVVGGFIEDYTVTYLKAGVGLFKPNRRVDYYLNLGVKYPVFIKEVLPTFNGAELEPGKKASLFAGLEWDVSKYRIKLYYEGFRFSLSSSAYIQSILQTVRQPESSLDVLGIRVLRPFY